jgi:hypothetical protein
MRETVAGIIARERLGGQNVATLTLMSKLQWSYCAGALESQRMRQMRQYDAFDGGVAPVHIDSQAEVMRSGYAA